jgi:hypothetical protein
MMTIILITMVEKIKYRAPLHFVHVHVYINTNKSCITVNETGLHAYTDTNSIDRHSCCPDCNYLFIDT